MSTQTCKKLLSICQISNYLGNREFRSRAKTEGRLFLLFMLYFYSLSLLKNLWLGASAVAQWVKPPSVVSASHMGANSSLGCSFSDPAPE